MRGRAPREDVKSKSMRGRAGAHATPPARAGAAATDRVAVDFSAFGLLNKYTIMFS